MKKVNYFKWEDIAVKGLVNKAKELEAGILMTKDPKLVLQYLDVYADVLQVKKLVKAKLVDYFIERNHIDNENNLRIQFHYIADILLADEMVDPAIRSKALKYLQLMTLQERMEKFIDILPDNVLNLQIVNVE